MRRNPFALPRVCSPGSALAAEVQAAGRGPGPPSTCGIAQLRTGGTGGTLVGLMPSALGTERAGAELAGGGGCLLSEKEGAFLQPSEHNPAGSRKVGGCGFPGARRPLAVERDWAGKLGQAGGLWSFPATSGGWGCVCLSVL